MDKIQIVNWLLTRECNLRCEYCGIVRDVHPFKKISEINKSEMTTEYVIDVLKLLKAHNPNCFHIFYGGEPFIRNDIVDILSFCNTEDIEYTIITNNTDVMQNKIDDTLSKVKIKGLSSSVDPGIFVYSNEENHQFKKSLEGFKNILKLRGKVPDLVAEVTITNDTIGYLYKLIKTLSDSQIISSITAVDIKKTKYYDFSNITDPKQLIQKSYDLREQFDKIMNDEDLLIHMKKQVIESLWEILPSNLDCKLEDGLHNLTIDSDGFLRLCLRISGKYTNRHVMAHELFAKDTDSQMISPYAKLCLTKDKRELCKGCNHTCQIMSQKGTPDEIAHLKIRN